METALEIWKVVLGGAVGSACVAGIFGIIMWALNRKAAKEDRKADREEQNEKKADSEMEDVKHTLDNLTIAMRTQLYLSIKRDGKSFLQRGSISAEELEDLVNAHKVYHDVLKGNGFLDSLMEKVKQLPVV